MKKENKDHQKGSLWARGSFAQTMSSGEMNEKMRTFHMKHDEEMNFSCSECKKKISAHNKDWHDGMCDGCFNAIYFPDEAQLIETDLEEIKGHSLLKPIIKENRLFAEFAQAGEFDRERFSKLVREIKDKVQCPMDKACCKFLDEPLTTANINSLIENAAKCPVVFNVLENAKEEFLEEIFAFENPNL